MSENEFTVWSSQVDLQGHSVVNQDLLRYSLAAVGSWICVWCELQDLLLQLLINKTI